jgi:cell pole-organizing protein PopZ
MSQAAKAQEPSMEEILASIRRIIADDDGAAPATKAEVKPEVKAPEPAPAPPPAPKAPPAVAKAPPPIAKAPPAPPKPAPAPPPPAPPAAAIKQDDIDAMLAGLDEPEPPKAAPKPELPKVAPKPEPAEPDVLELTEAMQAPATPPPPPAPAFRTIDGRQDVVFDDVAEPEPEPPRAVERPRPAPSLAPSPAPMPAMLNEQIISSATAAAVDSAFHALAQTVLVQNATTLEDLVKEMLRPMLQHWLDNNLPTLVERLVRAEIERVARGR